MASLEEIRVARLNKLKKLQEAGMDPYPAKTERNFEIGKLTDEFKICRKKISQ